jgi:hypothetical protein
VIITLVVRTTFLPAEWLAVPASGWRETRGRKSFPTKDFLPRGADARVA